MHQTELKHGFLVNGKLNSEEDFKPWLVTDTDHGLKLIKVTDVGIRPTHCGPHLILPSVSFWAEAHGYDPSQFSEMRQWGTFDDLEETYDVITEAEMILQDSIDPAYELSNWLKNSKAWPGSSASIIVSRDSAIAGAFITLHTANPYMLRGLLKWLGVPHHIVKSVTGIEK